MTGATIDKKLTSDVANAGTYFVSYPSGDTPASYMTTTYLEVGGGGQIARANYSVSLNSDKIVVTNNTGSTWPAGAIARLILTYKDTQSESSIIASRYCRYWYPWLLDSSANVRDVSGYAAAVVGSAGTQTSSGQYFTSIAGAVSAAGPGRYYEVGMNQANFDLNSYSAIIHLGFKKSAPGSTENIFGNQQNSSMPGYLVAATNTGAAACYIKSGSTQNTFTQISGVFNGMDRQLTLVFDHQSGNGYTYLDGVLQETKALTLAGSTESTAPCRFGYYSSVATARAADWFNCHMYVMPKAISDINIQNCVDYMVLSRMPLNSSHLGG